MGARKDSWIKIITSHTLRPDPASMGIHVFIRRRIRLFQYSYSIVVVHEYVVIKKKEKKKGKIGRLVEVREI